MGFSAEFIGIFIDEIISLFISNPCISEIGNISVSINCSMAMTHAIAGGIKPTKKDIKRKNGSILAGGDEVGEGRVSLELHYHLIKTLSIKKYNGINYGIIIECELYIESCTIRMEK